MALKHRRLLLICLLLGGSQLLAGCPRDAIDPRRSATRVDLAKDFLRRNELDAAEAEARKALELDRTSADAEYVLGMVAFMRGVANDRLLEVDDCLTGIDAEGLHSELEGYMVAADGHFARAVARDPEHAEAWSSRGTAADQLGEFGLAITYFEKALAHPHRLLDAGVTRANLGWAYFHRDDQVRAAKELRQAIQFNPGMCVARYRLGRVYFARKEWSKAAEQLQAVVGDRSCPMQEAHLYLGRSQREIGAAEGAQRALSSCLELAPKSCIAAECRAVPR
jgi:tetratricopeptide (TPR) repeat protein